MSGSRAPCKPAQEVSAVARNTRSSSSKAAESPPPPRSHRVSPAIAKLPADQVQSSKPKPLKQKRDRSPSLRTPVVVVVSKSLSITDLEVLPLTASLSKRTPLPHCIIVTTRRRAASCVLPPLLCPSRCKRLCGRPRPTPPCTRRSAFGTVWRSRSASCSGRYGPASRAKSFVSCGFQRLQCVTVVQDGSHTLYDGTEKCYSISDLASGATAAHFAVKNGLFDRPRFRQGGG